MRLGVKCKKKNIRIYGPEITEKRGRTRKEDS